jgi:hypothetical protein
MGPEEQPPRKVRAWAQGATTVPGECMGPDPRREAAPAGSRAPPSTMTEPESGRRRCLAVGGCRQGDPGQLSGVSGHSRVAVDERPGHGPLDQGEELAGERRRVARPGRTGHVLE